MRAIRLLGLLICLVGLAACFETPTAEVSFRCGPQGECPDGYECRDNGCCHLIGNSDDAVCPIIDARVVDAPVDAASIDAPGDAAPDASPADAAPDAM